MGAKQCLKSNKIYGNHEIYNSKIYYPFGIPNIRAYKRIGPHNRDVIAQLIGSLQGDGNAEKIPGVLSGTIFCFQQENKNVTYLKWLHKYLKERGYVNHSTKQKKQIRIDKESKISFIYRFKTFSFSSQNWLNFYFYPKNPDKKLNNKKIIPMDIIEQYFTALSLAILIMDDGTKTSKGLRLCLQGFTKEDVIKFSSFQSIRFKQKITQQTSNKERTQWYLYIHKKSMGQLSSKVKPYMVYTMHYKLNGWLNFLDSFICEYNI